FFAEALEAVRRGAGLESAAAEEARAGLAHALGRGKGLLAALYGAGPGDDRELAAAKRHEAVFRIAYPDADHRVFVLHFTAHQLVGLRDRDGLGDSGQDVEFGGL